MQNVLNPMLANRPLAQLPDSIYRMTCKFESQKQVQQKKIEQGQPIAHGSKFIDLVGKLARRREEVKRNSHNWKYLRCIELLSEREYNR